MQTGLLMLLHQLQKTVNDRVLGATWLQPRCGDLVADLLERGIIGNVPTRSISMCHHDRAAGSGSLFEMFVNHGHHFARYACQGDIVDHQQTESNADWVGVLPFIFLARQRTRFDLSAGASDHLLFAPELGLVSGANSSRDARRRFRQSLQAAAESPRQRRCVEHPLAYPDNNSLRSATWPQRRLR